jgi:hypothetical protein
MRTYRSSRECRRSAELDGLLREFQLAKLEGPVNTGNPEYVTVDAPSWLISCRAVRLSGSEPRFNAGVTTPAEISSRGLLDAARDRRGAGGDPKAY